MDSLLSQLEKRTRELRATATPKLASAASALQAGAKQAGALLAETAQTLAERAAATTSGSGGVGGSGVGGGAAAPSHELTSLGSGGGSSGLLSHHLHGYGSGGAEAADPRRRQQQGSPRHLAAAAAADNDADANADDDDALRHRLFARPQAAPDAAADEGARAHRVRMVLVAPGPVDLAALRRAAQQPGGLPSRDGLRAVAWKLLLAYLPPSADDWGPELARRREEYRRFCDELIVDPTAAAPPSAPAEANGGGSGGGGNQPPGQQQQDEQQQQQQQQQQQLPPVDHPLSTQSTSKWAEFFRDGEALAQIRRDVARTHPDSAFLGEDGGPAAARRRSEVARGLFVFAKLNPGVRYVQGMNELYAVLYWVFATDPSASAAAAPVSNGGGATAAPPTAAATTTTTTTTTPRPAPSDAEADAFWCFVALLSGPARDLFCASLDNDSAFGVRAVCARLARALRARDPELAAHLLDALSVDPRFFAFRWVTLMLAREFELETVMEVWDAALACGGGGGVAGDGGGAGGGAALEAGHGGGGGGGSGQAEEARLCFFLRMSLAMLSAVRERLLAADFAGCVKLLQHYPPDVPVRGLLAAALRAPPVPP